MGRKKNTKLETIPIEKMIQYTMEKYGKSDWYLLVWDLPLRRIAKKLSAKNTKYYRSRFSSTRWWFIYLGLVFESNFGVASTKN